MSKIGLKTYIIYKKQEGWELARLIFQSLKKNDINVEISEQNDSIDFEKNIKNKMDDSDIIIVVLSRHTFHNLGSCKNTLFYKQIFYCIDQLKSNSNNQKTIIPVIDDTTFRKPKGKLPKDFAYFNSCNTIFTNEKFYHNSINYLYKFIVELEFKSLLKIEGIDTTRINAKNYSLEYLEKSDDVQNEQIKKQVNLIKLQKRSHADLINNKDREVFKNIARSYNKELNILEIGCGTGEFAQYVLIDPSIKISQYYGFDPNKNSILIAKELFAGNSKFIFKKMDLLNIEENNQLFKQCDCIRENHIWQPKFDIVVIHNILKYFKYPKSIIATVKDLMNPNGTIIIGESDTGINLFFPDSTGNIETFFNFFNDCELCGNMKTGREVFNYLAQLQFNDVKLHSVFDSMADISSLKRTKLNFKNLYNLLISNYSKLKNDYPTNKNYNQALEWLNNNKQKIFKEISKNSFFMLISYMIWSAKK